MTRTVSLWMALLLAGCAGAQHPMSSSSPSPAPRAHAQVYGGEFVVVGEGSRTGGDAYDAMLLFERGNAAVHVQRCDDAITAYERLVREFPQSHLVPSAQYNRGVCLQSMGRFDDAVAALRETVAHGTDAALTRDAWFRIAVIGETSQRPPLVIEAVDAVLAMPNVSIVDQVEAHARRSAALLAQRDLPATTREAQRTIELAPTAEAVSALGDDTYIAEGRFVLAEVSRVQAEAVTIRVEDPELERAIERRVQFVVHAHVLYNDAIRVGNPHWAAACGYTIGDMYRGLYDSIVNAQVPSDWDDRAINVYRTRTASRLRPLLAGTLRAWEATLDMARRNGITDNDWARRTDQQIGALRELVLSGGASSPPPGRGAASHPAHPTSSPPASQAPSSAHTGNAAFGPTGPSGLG